MPVECLLRTPHEQFFLFYNIQMKSLPYAVHIPKATEYRLERIYTAAHAGLRGDSLAMAAGMLPDVYRKLCDLDPNAKLAELQGRADAELEHATLLSEASRAGDAKASLAILQHSHGWAAKQEISVTHISITAALEQAQQRVINADYQVLPG